MMHSGGSLRHRQRASQQQVNKHISQGNKASALLLLCCIRNDEKDDIRIRYTFSCHRLITIRKKSGIVFEQRRSVDDQNSSSCVKPAAEEERLVSSHDALQHFGENGRF